MRSCHSLLGELFYSALACTLSCGNAVLSSSLLTLKLKSRAHHAVLSVFCPLLGVFNGRVSDLNDRTLYVNLQRIKEQKANLAKQVQTANKLTSTVLSLSDDTEDVADEGEPKQCE